MIYIQNHWPNQGGFEGNKGYIKYVQVNEKLMFVTEMIFQKIMAQASDMQGPDFYLWYYMTPCVLPKLNSIRYWSY